MVYVALQVLLCRDISFEVYDIDESGASYFVSVQKIDKENEKSASTLTVEKENTLS